MIKLPYNEKSFTIDLLSSEYKTRDPNIIKQKSKEIFNDDLTISEIKDYLNCEEDFEKISYSIQMSEIF